MFTLNCKGRLLVVDKPLVMGIINLTPDSFYSGSRQNAVDAALKRADDMLTNGADILDIGGQSTRPGSERIDADQELGRVMPAIEALSKNFPSAFISIDTFYAHVAKQAVEAGASIVNDVSAGTLDADMLKTVAALRIPYILMHMQGNPQDMQVNPQYENVNLEVLDFFIRRIAELNALGIRDIVIDPGFGFGKTIQHNFTLLKNLNVFKVLERPILIGLSRKATVYKTLGITADEALNGTTVLHTIGMMNGADIIRVHDVKEAKEAVSLFGAYKEASL